MEKIVMIYDYEWATDDPTVWSPFEAAVLTIDEDTFNTVCYGDVREAVEGGHVEHTGEYEVAKPLKVPQNIFVYGDANKVAEAMCKEILGCVDTLEQWAEERGIDVEDARELLRNVKREPTIADKQEQLNYDSKVRVADSAT